MEQESPPRPHPHRTLEAFDRVEFERRRLPWRLAFLVAPLMLLFHSGFEALPAAAAAMGAILGSALLVQALIAWRPDLLVRYQWLLWVLDIALLFANIFLVRVSLNNGASFLDVLYLLPILAGAGANGVGTGVLLSFAGAVAAFAGRSVLAPAGFEQPLLPALIGSGFYCVLFLTVCGSVAVLMGLTADAAARHEQAWYRAILERNSLLEKALLDLKVANYELAVSRYDGVTGAISRREFDGIFMREWHHAQRGGSPLSVLMIDVDCFKRFNDSLGHLEGDQALRAIARALGQSVTRTTDVVARYGGEEFVIILPDTPAPGAEVVAHRARNAVEALHIPHPDSSASRFVTVSIGVATASLDWEISQPATELIEQADAALYRAKDRGRNRVEVAENSQPQPEVVQRFGA